MEDKNIIDLLKYINEEIENEQELSELKIHKVLYFLYANFYKETGKQLFNNPEFEAWKYGPVEIKYRRTLKEGKNDFYEYNIEQKDKGYLKGLIITLLKKDVWHLVHESHIDKPWFDLTKDGSNLFVKIPNEYIRKYYKGKNKKRR